MNANAAELQALHAGYDGHRVLLDVDLRLAYGEWLCLLGANGSGKSTLLKCLAGLHVPRSGTVRIGGQLLDQDGLEARRRLGVVPAPEALPALLTVSQCLAVYAAAKRLPDWGKDVLTLAEALSFTPYLDMPVAALSLGTRQKLAVLLGLLGEPELILMDESFNGLDPHSALVLKRHLRERLDMGGCGLLLATHSLDIVERHADRALLLHEGRLQREWSREEIALAREAGGMELALASCLDS